MKTKTNHTILWLIFAITLLWPAYHIVMGRAPQTMPGPTTRLSVDSNEAQADGASHWVTMSSDGRFVAFSADATNLVVGDTNGARDVFVRDTATGTTDRVSIASDGTEGNFSSDHPSISDDGRYITFHSSATNLVADDNNNVSDIFVRDRLAGTTIRVSEGPGGEDATDVSYDPVITPDGRYLAYWSHAPNIVVSDTNGYADIFVYGLLSGATTIISKNDVGQQGNGDSRYPSISDNGFMVAFESEASNLVVADTNGYVDIFVHNWLVINVTQRVNLGPGGVQSNGPSERPAISGNGLFVAFASMANNLVSGDSNGQIDIFVYPMATGETELASVSSSGTQSTFLSENPFISQDGQFVIFASPSGNLVPGDGNGAFDTFVRDRDTGTTTRASIDSGGIEGNHHSSMGVISTDGGFVAFLSFASNLVTGDTNGATDVFLHDRQDLIPPTATPLPTITPSPTPIVRPELRLNWHDGAPGSYFTVTGINFDPNDTMVIMVNGFNPGTVTTDANGRGEFQLCTNVTGSNGLYLLSATTSTLTDNDHFHLDDAAPLRPVGNDPILTCLPDDPVMTEVDYMPIIQR